MVITPEEDAPLGCVSMADLSVLERAKLACNTAKTLTPDVPDTPPTQEEAELARDMFTAVTSAKKKGEVNISTLANYPNASLRHLDRMLSEYDQELINSAVRIREFVKNRLLVEADNADGKIRIRALELLGKIKDVGLFTDRIEVTHKTKSDEELAEELHKKLEKYMGMVERVDDEKIETAVEGEEEQKERQLYGLIHRLET
jgi:hypothetical protein